MHVSWMKTQIFQIQSLCVHFYGDIYNKNVKLLLYSVLEKHRRHLIRMTPSSEEVEMGQSLLTIVEQQHGDRK